MIHGYARCSTNESKQDIDRQVRELKAAGAETVFLEYEHGDAAVKKQLSSLLETAAEGDTIIALEVSRLARSTKQLCEVIEVIRAKRLRLVIVGSITLDCRAGQADPMSEAFLQMAGVFSQLELAMIRARVRSGMENARTKGRKIGRPQTTIDQIPSGFLRHYPAYKSGQLNLSELARVCDLVTAEDCRNGACPIGESCDKYSEDIPKKATAEQVKEVYADLVRLGKFKEE